MSGEYTRAIRNHYIEGRAAHAECSARLIRMASMWADESGGDVQEIQVPGKARFDTWAPCPVAYEYVWAF